MGPLFEHLMDAPPEEAFALAADISSADGLTDGSDSDDPIVAPAIVKKNKKTPGAAPKSKGLTSHTKHTQIEEPGLVFAPPPHIRLDEETGDILDMGPSTPVVVGRLYKMRNAWRVSCFRKHAGPTCRCQMFIRGVRNDDDAHRNSAYTVCKMWCHRGLDPSKSYTSHDGDGRYLANQWRHQHP